MSVCLCLGTFFTVVLSFKANASCFNKDIVGNMINAFDSECDVDNRMISHIKAGTRNLSKCSTEVFAQFDTKFKSDVSARINKNVLPLLKEKESLSKAIKVLILEDKSISDGEIVDLFNKTCKKDLRKANSRTGSFLGGVLLYTVLNTSNIKKEDEVSKINDAFFKKVEICFPSKQTQLRSIIVQESIESEAKRFCIENKDEITLLPLCPFADYLDSTKPDTREIYNNYKTQKASVKKAIFKLKKTEFPVFTEKNWINARLDKLLRMIQDNDLARIDLFYDEFKYFHRAYMHNADEPVTNPNPSIFPRIFEVPSVGWFKETPCNLEFYIDSYIWARINEPDKKVIPPFDLINQTCDLERATEARLTFWMCRFIIDCCKNLDTSQCFFEAEDKIRHQDEMYFLALFYLYNLQ